MARMSGKISGKKKEMTGKGTGNSGGSCCTYGRGLLYLRKSTGKNKSVRKRKLPNFIFKCLRKHFFNDQNMVHPEYGVIGYLNEH